MSSIWEVQMELLGLLRALREAPLLFHFGSPSTLKSRQDPQKTLGPNCQAELMNLDETTLVVQANVRIPMYPPTTACGEERV